jgi:hypothetical protein
MAETPEQAAELSRRRFLQTAAALMAPAVMAGCGISESPTPPEVPETDLLCAGAPAAEAVSDTGEYPATFANHEAQAVAENLSINPGSYFKLNEAAVRAINDRGLFRARNWLAPIFPPAVSRFERQILAAANEFNVPPNMLASLATIESAGNTGARSGADAHGIIQVVPRYHAARIDQVTGRKFRDDSERAEFLRLHPEECLRVGASYFAECIAGAKRRMRDPHGHSLVTYAKAASAYNGGPSRAHQDYEDLPLESQLYVNHVARLTLDVAVAAELRKRGLDDNEILDAMQSGEMNARAYAYDGYERGSTSIAPYEQSAFLCSTPEPGRDPDTGRLIDGDANMINQRYHRFLRSCETANPWRAPATPGLRIWLVGGGDQLFLQVPANRDWRLQ